MISALEEPEQISLLYHARSLAWHNWETVFFSGFTCVRICSTSRYWMQPFWGVSPAHRSRPWGQQSCWSGCTGRWCCRLCCAGSQYGSPTHDKGHVERTWRQRQIRTRGTPWTCSSTYPKTRVCLTILWLSPTPLTLTGGYPRPPFSEGHQLKVLVNKSPGHNRWVPIQSPQIAF